MFATFTLIDIVKESMNRLIVVNYVTDFVLLMQANPV